MIQFQSHTVNTEGVPLFCEDRKIIGVCMHQWEVPHSKHYNVLIDINNALIAMPIITVIIQCRLSL